MGASIATAQGGVASLAAVLCGRRGGADRAEPRDRVHAEHGRGLGVDGARARGPVGSPCTACAASAMAVGEGYDAIRLGRAEVMLCGGSEAGITPLAVAGFAAMRALSRRNDEPTRASRPFDAERDGFVMGEGAAVLVLEELEHARARGATDLRGARRVRRELRLVPHDGARSGRGRTGACDPRRARRRRRRAEDVDYVNAHASSTDARRRDRDRRDQARARRGEGARDAGLFDQGGDRPLPRSGGRCRGGGDRALDPRQRRAADDQLRASRPGVRSRLRPERGAAGQVDIAVSNSFGFGGHNAVLVFRRTEA